VVSETVPGARTNPVSVTGAAEIATAAVSATPLAACLAITRKLPATVPAVNSPEGDTVPPVAEYSIGGRVVEPSLQSADTENCWAAPGSRFAADGVTVTEVTATSGGPAGSGESAGQPSATKVQKTVHHRTTVGRYTYKSRDFIALPRIVER
jgi:hypothetical protein